MNRVRDLKRTLGKKSMKAERVREALVLSLQEETVLALAVVAQTRGRHPAGAMARAPAVSRSD
jgi:hypothetical protein